MLYVILWYVVIFLLGWLTFPLAFRLLPGLADRGFTLSRTLGLLLWGYLFWLLASLGVLRNDRGGLLFAFALLIALSLWSARQTGFKELRNWLYLRKRWIVGIELLFLAAFVGWAFVRSANPEALGTEKPMELAFINAILDRKSVV